MATSAQHNAFTTGAGGLSSMDDFSLMFALICSSLIMLFAGWVIISAFKAWNKHRMDFYEMMWTVIRVFVLVMMFGYFVRP